MAKEVSAREKRLRIDSISLKDFRAFPGPDELEIELGTPQHRGTNLLLYGENGAGKSSLFEAFRGLFARRPDRQFFKREKNVFSGQSEADAAVTVKFTDGKESARWTIPTHPGRAGGDPRIIQTALRAAMLDYRALLDTNYGQGSEQPNLFDIAMNLLLADWPLASGDTLGELWEKTKATRPYAGWDDQAVQAACATFNTEFAAAVDALTPFARDVLKDLIADSIILDQLEYGTVKYVNAFQLRDRIFGGRLLRPRITYRAHGLQQPQLFLNEARQSALALAVYLSARLACTQAAPEDAPKLVVLDDLLIGLDQSNRLPVLDVLMKHFADWQIVMLTHDRTWFDMARAHLAPTTDWAYVELHEAPTSASTSMPVVRRLGPGAADSALDQAEAFCDHGHIAAAATYARTAFELGLRQWAERGSVAVRFRVDPRDVSTDDLISAIRIKKASDPNSDAARALRAVEMFRTTVLSPLSHATPPQIVKSEVQGAMAAVRFLLTISKVK
ncbi:AAA family ATPase [Mesorhizobium sp. BR-1-1-8]|uniref:AAA family ATPase n=1 Tax=Mesorhizobium sp. BR-1-1-8 TaxID=2876659 RepID=UPI001CCD7341|nr:AAA family ATPase [Mesorhizobium sp. BR-1-1-8]MBZ9983983.1 AAA family ATPase [Mesorhizobium sp. BR-1-1-8]